MSHRPRTRQRFKSRSLAEFERVRRRLGVAVLSLLLVMLVGVVGFAWIGAGEHSIIDAIYMTTITLTTVGFGEVIDMSHNPAGRLFTVALLLMGMGIVAYSLPTVTAFLIEVNPGSHELHLINAGHLPVLRWMSKEKKLRVAATEGIALGLDKGPIFDERLQTSKMTLNIGDRVVIYTEGVFKIESADGEELGEVGFNKLIAKNAPMHSAAFMNLVERTMEKFREDGPETDDYTIITLKAV